VGRTLEVWDPITLIPAPRAAMNVGMELHASRSSRTTRGASASSGFEVLTAS
jgi:hypothetical protein